MGLTELSVKRPAAVIVFMVLLIGLGILGYTSMGVDLLPTVNVPVITITTVYNGAGAEEIKKDIVKPIEDAVAGISGIDTLRSTAREGVGLTIIQFTMETNMNSAFLDVQKAVDHARGKLPAGAEDPILYKVDINAQSVMTLAITGDVPYDQLYNQADKIKQSIEKLPGIGQVSLQGANDKQLNVKLDKTAIEYYGINVNTLIGKIRSENTNMPAGQMKQEKSDLTVKMVGEFKDLNDIKSIQIPTSSGGIVRLADIASLELGYPDNDTILKMNDKNAIGINIQKQSDANVVKAVDGVNKELEKIQKLLPAGVKLSVTTDSTVFIKSSLNEVLRSLVEGIITTSIVLFLFLRSWQSSLIVLVAIPTSLISTFFIMYENHFTLNVMSLMGLSLCIGILVDDSIVVLENIQRHRAMGEKPIEAAIKGRSEIGMAAIAITLCDVVIFGPVAFTSGMVGQFFKEFGITVAVASLFSLLVSFTVTPMLASRLAHIKMGKEEGSTKKQGRISKLFGYATELYKKFLLWSLDNRWKIIGITLAGVILSIALVPLGLIHTEFMPVSDQSQLNLDISLTPGSSLKQTEEKVAVVEKHLRDLPEMKEYYTTIGNNSDKSSANIILKLKDTKDRKKSQNQLAGELRQWGKTIPGIQLSITEAQSTPGSNGKPIQVTIKGDDIAVLKEISYKVEELVKSVEGAVDVSNSLRTSESEIRVNIDRLACAQYGVSTSDIATVLRTGLQGSNVGVFRGNGNEYDISVKFMNGQINKPGDLGSVKVMNASGQQIAINQVASISVADSQLRISREDRQDTVTVSANLQNALLGKVSGEIKNKLDGLTLPYGYSVKYGGMQQNMSDGFISLGKAMAGGIVLVFMVLIVLYESFLTPFIRMLSLPCAIIGAFVLLAITRQSLNIMSMIGLILLDGLASKNGTLLIDYTNTLMKRGLSLKEALVEAGTTRLRPIIMTSATMVVGMLPSALATGSGSEMRNGMAIIVIGGMITSTILSPILLPVVYTLIEDLRVRFSKKHRSTVKIGEVESYEV
ncbi:MAG: efflux RND transporter permease subunit [Clostridia bacterium]|nr:efflux RND transporter permease subunit [Clostridia bacterium]